MDIPVELCLELLMAADYLQLDSKTEARPLQDALKRGLHYQRADITLRVYEDFGSLAFEGNVADIHEAACVVGVWTHLEEVNTTGECILDTRQIANRLAFWTLMLCPA